MNSRDNTIRSRAERTWMKLVPAAVAVGLSLAACASDPRNGSTYDTDPNEPYGQSCESQGFNCGTATDSYGNRENCGTCAGVNNRCLNNRCERSCTSNSECGGNTRCYRGSCTTDTGNSSYDRCTDSRDCEPGQYCMNGYCSTNGSGQSCRYTTDCQNGQQCVNGYCNTPSSSQTCYNNADCGFGATCSNGYCYGGSNQQSCVYNTDCPYGQVCNSGYCSGNNYGNGYGQACRYSTDCATGQSCNNGYCQGGSGSGYGQTCRYNSDCPGNQTCNGGYCGGGYSYGSLRAQCVTSGINFFGFIDVFSEQVLYSPQFPSGVRVDSCICQNGVLRAQIDSYGGYADTYCSRCVKDGADRYCYQ